jgi:DNA (cytosine-5)-methyltransferase 1
VPRLLDLFCGAGGCSVGYARAGFDVVGVDIEPHPEYPFEFHQADAMTYPLEGFDAVHASPPCQRYAAGTPDRERHPDLVGPIRKRLIASGVTYVIENVPGAPLDHPTMVCAAAVGLKGIRRHRLFESSTFLMSPGCACSSTYVFGIYGDHGNAASTPVRRPDGSHRTRKARNAVHAGELMGIDWMTKWDDLTDAIPPAYTQFIGEQVILSL